MKTNVFVLGILGAAIAVLANGCGGGSPQVNAPVVPPVFLTPELEKPVTQSPLISPETTIITPPAGSPSVASITPDDLRYGGQSTFVVTGQNLDYGITFTAPGCNSINALGGGTDTTRIYSCNPAVAGAMPVTISSTDGLKLASYNAVVPQPQVTMKTSMGDIVLELYPDKAPVTVANFLQYVKDTYYDNLIFHRVIPEFVIQGGGYNANLQHAVTRPAIKLEAANGLSNERGALAMARSSVLNSATSEFFINTVDNPGLDTTGGGYAVFGKVITGLTVVDKIEAVPTQTVNDKNDVPVTPVVINTMRQTQ